MNDQGTTIWGVTGASGGDSGYVVCALFTTEVEARRYAAVADEYGVEEFTLYDKAPEPYPYWLRIAHVYPDGTVEEWTKEHIAQPPLRMAPVESDPGLWERRGLQTISVFGADREAVEQAFQRRLREAMRRVGTMA